MSRAKSKTPLNDDLERMKSELVALRSEHRQERSNREALQAEADGIADALLTARATTLAGGTADVDTKALQARREEATAALADASQLEALTQAVAIKQAEIGRFATRYSAELIKELTPAAGAVRRDLEQWLAQFDGLCQGWLTVFGRVNDVLQLADGRDPRNELSAWDPRAGSLRSEVRDLLAAGVPTPLPHGPAELARLMSAEELADETPRFVTVAA